MKNLTYQDVETVALVLFGVVFYLYERFSPKHKELDRKSHLKLDIAAFILLLIAVGISRLIAENTFRMFSMGTNLLQMSSWPFLIQLLVGHLISDFCLYWLHRGMHSNSFLWRTHQFHHSAESLYWFSGFRTSFMHAFLYAFPQVLVGFFCFEFTPMELGIAFSLGAISNFFTHANINLPKWLPLHYVIVTPDFHHPHHSQMGTQNKNFGNVFSIWDRLFGTYVDPSRIRSDFKYGLKEKPALWRMMIGL